MMALVLIAFALAATVMSHFANPVIITASEDGYDYR